MAERVVEHLEVVEVEHDQADRLLRGHRALQVLLEGAVVAQPGQRVGGGERLEVGALARQPPQREAEPDHDGEQRQADHRHGDRVQLRERLVDDEQEGGDRERDRQRHAGGRRGLADRAPRAPGGEGDQQRAGGVAEVVGGAGRPAPAELRGDVDGVAHARSAQTRRRGRTRRRCASRPRPTARRRSPSAAGRRAGRRGGRRSPSSPARSSRGSGAARRPRRAAATTVPPIIPSSHRLALTCTWRARTSPIMPASVSGASISHSASACDGKLRSRGGRELQVVERAAAGVQQQPEPDRAPGGALSRQPQRPRHARRPAGGEHGDEEPRRNDVSQPVHDPRLIDIAAARL